MNACTARPPAVAGMFYPGNGPELAHDLRAMLAAVPAVPAVPLTPTLPCPKALVVPHAGYMYSGPVAARAYAQLVPHAATISRVVLLGPCHRVAVQGLAVPDTPKVSAFTTPLGDVPLDGDALNSIATLPQVVRHDDAHAQEHSLEVQLPFLQTVLGSFRLVPIAVGRASPAEVAEVLERLWGGPETLIVVSSDLSHYLGYEEAQHRDRATVDAIVHLHPLTHHDQACGAIPINGLLIAAHRYHLKAQLLDLRNSGDTAGDKSRVVGYASIAFFLPDLAQPAPPPASDLGAALLARARNTIAQSLGLPSCPEPDHPALTAPGASFVTLTQAGQLRGCIGSLEAWRPLDADLRENARAAAFRDPRFPPLTADELARTRVEVSLLTPAVALPVADEADALRQMRPGIDGLIFECHGRRGTFLPQVWESLPEPRQFLAHLKQKAGFAPDFWSPDVKLYRYEVQKWKEAGKI